MLPQWFINIKESITENVKAVGKKLEERVLNFLPYTPYNIYDCTIGNYIKIVVDNDTKRIIKKGYTSYKNRINCINNLYYNFSKAQGNQISKMHDELRMELLKMCIEMQRLQIAKLLLVRDFNGTVRILKEMGVVFPFKESCSRAVLLIDSQYNQRDRRKKEIESKLQKTTKVASDDKPTRQDYIDSLFRLGISVELGYKVDETITLAEFASLIKIRKEKEKSYEKLKQRSHTKR